jgi:hypothetical protein
MKEIPISFLKNNEISPGKKNTEWVRGGHSQNGKPELSSNLSMGSFRPLILGESYSRAFYRTQINE